MRRALPFLFAFVVVSCSAPQGPVAPPVPPGAAGQAAEAVPTGRLPSDVRPIHYDLELAIDPTSPTFTGKVSVRIDLDRTREVIWLHGNQLDASEATVTPVGGEPISARYEQVDPSGVVKLTLARPVGPGDARLDIAFSGPFDERLDGLYRVKSGDDWYAFTQMEPVWTRKAFPCFDEPAFKTKWDVTLEVPSGLVAIGNTREKTRESNDGRDRISYETTEPLPSYLIAFAVGPLDVVEAPDIPATAVRKRPLPFRGIAVKGRGPELAHALAGTPAILVELERYFDIEYPYDKLDIIAVPDKRGAMENAGAITFREWLILLDEKNADVQQRRAFAYVMAHELAHQWFGNLVTMPWWDDIWLNEAFATWMGYRAVHAISPEHQADLRLVSGIHFAMDQDRLTTARQIRQPVTSDNDIHDAFDAITYRKGGGVLAMFERWLGPDTFREGLRAYMRHHAHGSATAEDLLRALSSAAKKDVATPFNSFLLKPGIPFVEVTPRCAEGRGEIALAQSRFLPLGSGGNREATWHIPMCIRYGLGKDGSKVEETCTLLVEPTRTLSLDGCPAWVMPNAEASGYFQWSLDPQALAALVEHGLPRLSVREKMSFAKAVEAAFELGALDTSQTLRALLPLARDGNPEVAAAPMAILRRAHHWLESDPLQAKVEMLGRSLYADSLKRVGWTAARSETPERALLRQRIIGFLAITARDPKVRKQAADHGRKYLGLGGDEKIHPEALDPNLVPVAMQVLGEEADAALFDAILSRLPELRDDVVREHLLTALGAVRDASLAPRALGLALNENVRATEALSPIFNQLGHPQTREGAWRWLADHLGELLARLSARSASWLPNTATVFCDESKAVATGQLFEAHMARAPGGPRELAKAVETIRLCAATKKAQLPSTRAYFTQ